MQEGNKSLGTLKNVKFGREILKSCSLHKEVGERPISRWLHFSRNQIYQEKNEDIRIVPKQNNSLKAFPYAIQEHLAMHQSDFTLQIPS